MIRDLSDVERIERELRAEDLPSSTYEMLMQGARIAPDATALSFFLSANEHAKPETWSYRELLANITRTANMFHALGAQRDTVIAYVLPNLPETHFTLWGGEAAGIVMAINPLLEPNTIAQLLNAAKASIVVTLAPFPKVDLWSKMAEVLPRVASLRDVVLVNLADRVRGPKRMIAKMLQKRAALRVKIPRGLRVHDFWRTQRKQASVLHASIRISPDDASSYFCTGGTTGTPKIAVRRHRNEVFNAWSATQCFGEGIGAGKTVLCGLPLFHVNAVLATGLAPFSRGAHVVLATPQGYRGEGVIPRFWELIERHRVHFFSGVPTLYGSLLQVPVGSHRVDSLEYGVCGAAPLPVQVMREFEQRTGIKLLEGYGLTEGTCVSSVNPMNGERRVGSVGLRLPGQLLKAVILEEGKYVRDCATDEPGALVISGANVFDGYLLPEQNTKLFPDLGDGRRWLDTGDLGRVDADGYVWLTGRKKELIIRGGHNIDPATIEEPLHRHPAVQVAAAVGRPDAHAGELPVAYVQLRPSQHATPEELLAFLRDEISERAALPKAVHVLAEMPVTAVGKIFKPALRALEIRSALEAALNSSSIAARRVEVLEDAARGTAVRAELADPGQRDAAASVLGSYPFPFELV